MENKKGLLGIGGNAQHSWESENDPQNTDEPMTGTQSVLDSIPPIQKQQEPGMGITIPNHTGNMVADVGGGTFEIPQDYIVLPSDSPEDAGRAIDEYLQNHPFQREKEEPKE